MKAFIAHFITAIIYWLMVFYVLGTEETTSPQRFMVCFLFICTQLIPLAICIENKYYEQS